ncbi:MAG: DUF4296 domain-containing protein [Niabella sp.]
MRYFLPTFILAIFLTACSGTSSGVLPKEKMQKVLWEVTQGGEFLNGYVYSRHPELNRVAVNNQMLERIFKINNITRKQFNKSLEYYRNNPKELAVLLDSVTAQQQRLQKKDSSSKKPAPLVDKPVPVNPR